ncbi:DUF4149 domain-containing protein [Rubrobacter aplysinae]|uniref:DUF4149 domain-containing protein n=1 Tax=Rubrobacter aplysinae TaxID=909625 RepID=UPI00069F6453|nr:DUF4149 domain-containing protein [Rubrobacter aplysinae]
MYEVVQVVHAVLAGVWLGGLVFTTFVVSPALKAMKWSEAERVMVRSVIGRYYSRLATPNLSLLLLFAVLAGVLGGFGGALYAELALVVVVFALSASHGAYFGQRLRRLAEAERGAPDEEAGSLGRQRRKLQDLSVRVSALNLVLSTAVAVLAVV